MDTFNEPESFLSSRKMIMEETEATLSRFLFTRVMGHICRNFEGYLHDTGDLSPLVPGSLMDESLLTVLLDDVGVWFAR